MDGLRLMMCACKESENEYRDAMRLLLHEETFNVGLACPFAIAGAMQ